MNNQSYPESWDKSEGALLSGLCSFHCCAYWKTGENWNKRIRESRRDLESIEELIDFVLTYVAIFYSIKFLKQAADIWKAIKLHYT